MKVWGISRRSFDLHNLQTAGSQSLCPHWQVGPSKSLFLINKFRIYVVYDLFQVRVYLFPSGNCRPIEGRETISIYMQKSIWILDAYLFTLFNSNIDIANFRKMGANKVVHYALVVVTTVTSAHAKVMKDGSVWSPIWLGLMLLADVSRESYP